ncbi:MAG: acyltransferase [Bacillota bacterium]|nr:acyltransferase [Bacillota bacterium]
MNAVTNWPARVQKKWSEKFKEAKKLRQEIADWYTTMRAKRHLASYGNNLRARNPREFFLGKCAEVHIGNNVLLERQVRFSLGDGARVVVGDDTYLGDGCNVLAVKEITFGKGCAISWHVLFMDTSSHPLAFDGGEPVTRIGPIHIEDHVWIGCRAVILKGVTIGEGAIVANNAVVTRDVPPRTMVGGNPARVIREDVVWE